MGAAVRGVVVAGAEGWVMNSPQAEMQAVGVTVEVGAGRKVMMQSVVAKRVRKIPISRGGEAGEEDPDI